LCTDYADVEEHSNTEGNAAPGHLFGKLMFLIRNCQDAEEFGEDLQRFHEIVKYLSIYNPHPVTIASL